MKKDSEIIRRRQEAKDWRLDPSWQPATIAPVLGAPVRYEMAERVNATTHGGIGLVTQLVDFIGLPKAINERLRLFKRHQPYHESDHVLNMTYNVVVGGRCLDDLKLRRQDVAYLDALGARRLPDATTAGDFLRRFREPDVVQLMESINEARQRVWRSQPSSSRRLALIDVDGTIAPTLGNKKEGADFAYNGIWGYGPLIVSLANSQEVLYVANRSASRPSHDGAAKWLDKSIELAQDGGFKKVRLRGDTDFSLTANFDRWSDAGVEFVFGIDANRTFISRAEELASEDWRVLPRRRRGRKASSRLLGRNFRDEIVLEREFTNYRLVEEHFAEITYRPRKSKKNYRMVILRKRISVEKGQLQLTDQIRYFFYVTNISLKKLNAKKTIFESNARCNQENLIEQLKNGVRATQMPSGDFMANWAYMVIGTLAWNLKIWLGLTLPNSAQTQELLRMEYRRFVTEVITFATQILDSGRYRVFRPLTLTNWTEFILAGSQWFRQCKRRYA